MNGFFQNINGFYILFLFASLVGAFFVGRRGRAKEISEATTQLNETLDREIGALRRRVADLEKDRNRQDRILSAIRYALKEYNLKIVIDHEFVTLIDSHGRRRTANLKNTGKVQPLKPQREPDEDEDEEQAEP